jgi:formylglycine-generating enzyme required for sulfatase activity
MKFRFRTLMLLLVGLHLAGCDTAPVQQVTRNQDWQPVVETFGRAEMVLVPPGCFMMGYEEGRRDQRPAHQICFDAPFWIDRYEVTNQRFGSTGRFEGDLRPRENLSWFEARDFCVSQGGRLPTEAEWEYATRGPDNLLYPWGNDFNDNFLIFDRNANGETVDVGSRPEGVSWVGAYDMIGNVYEWVSSIHRPYPYNPTDGREDADDIESLRVYRSGWASTYELGVSAPFRIRTHPNTYDWFIGFRCARDY